MRNSCEMQLTLKKQKIQNYEKINEITLKN